MSDALSRRDFLQTGAAAAGGLVVAMHLPACRAGAPLRSGADLPEAIFAPNAWLRITPDDRIIFYLAQVEMGQGTMTSQVQLVAEELEVSVEQIEVRFAPVDPAFNNPRMRMQITGGSSSTPTSFVRLREAGASARARLVAAAASRFGVSAKTCHAEAGRVHHTASGKSASYGELAAAAAQTQAKTPPLKPREAMKVVGHAQRRKDARAKVDGSAIFGLDVQLPGLLCAVVIRPPQMGATLRAHRSARARTMSGVEAVFSISRGVAVVAETFWQARQAARAVELRWQARHDPPLDDRSILADYRALLRSPGKVLQQQGDAEAALAGAATVIDATYEAPFLAHATLEPQNATAWVREGRCELWVPTQAAGLAEEIAAGITGFSSEQITVHTTFLGGGFGRRGHQDFVAEAVEISNTLRRPVKVIFTRADDLATDFYRPAYVHRVRAGLDASGKPVGWSHRVAGQSILFQVMRDWAGSMLPGWVPSRARHFLGSVAADAMQRRDPTSVEGADELPYAIGAHRLEYHWRDPEVPVGFWRSVGHSVSAFAVESMIDELAHAAGRDPYTFRRELLAEAPQHRQVLEAAAEAAGYDETLPAGEGRGIALHRSFETTVAVVVQVRVEGAKVSLRRITCAIDCGLAVNPDGVKAQMEGSMIFGLSAALFQEITLREGKVQEENFDAFELLTVDAVPPIEVVVLDRDTPPTGVGEPGVPPTAPALAGAIFAATGHRLRRLPLLPALRRALAEAPG